MQNGGRFPRNTDLGDEKNGFTLAVFIGPYSNQIDFFIDYERQCYIFYPCLVSFFSITSGLRKQLPQCVLSTCSLVSQ